MCQRLRQCVNPLPEQMTILPKTIVENEGKVNACPNLIAATHWILYTHMCQWLRTIPLPERMTVLPNQCANGYASARLRLCASGYANVRLRLCANGYTNVRIPLPEQLTILPNQSGE